MAIFEKDNKPTYETFIEQEVRKDEHGEVTARALVKLPVKTSQWLLLGGAAAGTAQTCIVAVTQKVLVMIMTKQDLIETPEIAQVSVFPLDKVKVLNTHEGWLDNSLEISIDGEETKLEFIKLDGWSAIEQLAASLPK
jgi:hypothetical protein